MQTDGKTRRFEVVDPATITDPVALSVGLYGFTGTGKTESAMRLAFGIRRITGGRVILADCDNGRGLHFCRGPSALFPETSYVDFRAPHNARDYIGLLEQMAGEKGVLVIDNMSAEHDGEGGLLDSKEAAMYDRNGNYKEGRAAVAWNEAKTPHKAMVRAFVRVNRQLPIIVTWRAQEKLDWSAKNEQGRSEPKSQGEMPIGSRDLPFEMTATYLLPIGSRGTPCLAPTERGEQMMTKIPRWFADIVKPGKAFTEDHGEAMARWAFGGVDRPDVARLLAALECAPDGAAIDALGREATALAKGGTITKADLGKLVAKAKERRGVLASGAPSTVPEPRPTPKPEPAEREPGLD
jgi:hypothetical protein